MGTLGKCEISNITTSGFISFKALDLFLEYVYFFGGLNFKEGGFF